MKNLFHLVLMSMALIMAACSGSETYQGDWKAMAPDGVKADLHFDAKTFTETDSAGVSTSFQYSQNSVNIANGVKSFGIQLKEGGAYRIVFPISGDVTKGVITTEVGNVLYTICRTGYVTYEEVYPFGK